MSAKLEVQNAVFSALTSYSTFTVATQGRLFDHVTDNSDYPYTCLAATNTLPANRHGRKGWNHLFTFTINTQPGVLGSYTREKIFGAMDDVLNLKTFPLSTTAYNLVKVVLVSKNDFEDNDIWGSNVTYSFIVHDSREV
jgi:hypothetical protein